MANFLVPHPPLSFALCCVGKSSIQKIVPRKFCLFLPFKIQHSEISFKRDKRNSLLKKLIMFVDKNASFLFCFFALQLPTVTLAAPVAASARAERRKTKHCAHRLRFALNKTRQLPSSLHFHVLMQNFPTHSRRVLSSPFLFVSLSHVVKTEAGAR